MIKFENVSMVYENGTAALNNVSLTIEDGEFVFLIGHSGAGKTTLTKLLICEERISSGKLEVNGFHLEKIRPWRIAKLRRTMGVVFQDFKLFDNMTVYENVAFAMRVVGAKNKLIKKRVPFFLDVVGLGHKSRSFPNQLSGGEKQRVAFARALVNNPDTIIADEPTGNVDTEMSEGIMELLVKINKLGKTVIVVTHDMQLVETYKKRVIHIENGIIHSDKPGVDFNIDEMYTDRVPEVEVVHPNEPTEPFEVPNLPDINDSEHMNEIPNLPNMDEVLAEVDLESTALNINEFVLADDNQPETETDVSETVEAKDVTMEETSETKETEEVEEVEEASESETSTEETVSETEENGGKTE